jgi:PAS domain-containing protein
VLDAVPDSICILNEERQIVFANQALCRAFGYDSLEEVLGLRPGEALRCLNSLQGPDGCGTARFCRNCGAAKAIAACQRDRMTEAEECRVNVTGGRGKGLWT